MKISSEKKEKISEQILAHLYSISPRSEFTAHISREIARDEEFTKDLLLSLKRKNLVGVIKKSPKGENYLRRLRWKLSDNAYKVYKDRQQREPFSQ